MDEKNSLIEMLKDEFNRWEALLSGMNEEQANDPKLPAGLSVKDVVAHLWAWQQRSIARMQAALQGRAPVFPDWPDNLDPDKEEDLDQINAWIYTDNHNKSWEQVYADWRAGFQEFIQLCQAVPEQDLLAPGKYPWLWGQPLALIPQASCNHHREEHYEPLVAWLRQHGELN